MVKFVAACPMPGGVFTASEHEISGSTTAELRDAAWARCEVGRYVSSIYAVVDDGPAVTVYTESGGWRITDPTDEAQITVLK